MGMSSHSGPAIKHCCCDAAARGLDEVIAAPCLPWTSQWEFSHLCGCGGVPLFWFCDLAALETAADEKVGANIAVLHH
jgi:hypothetical protein